MFQSEHGNKPKAHCKMQAAAAGRCWNVRSQLNEDASSTVGRIHMVDSCLAPGLYHTADAFLEASRQVRLVAPTLYL